MIINKLMLTLGLVVCSLLVFSQSNGINAQDENGETRLSKAIKNQDKQEFDDTLSAGADISAPNSEGETPIVLAVENNQWEMGSTLLDQGAYASSKNSEGKSILLLCVEKRQYDFAQNLINRGANVNAGDPIVVAVQNKDEQMIDILAMGKANLEPGVNAAADNADLSTIKYLILKGVKLKNTNIWEKALETENKEMASVALDNEFPANDALKPSLEVENYEFMLMALEEGAKSDDVIPFAVRRSDPEFFTDLLSKYNADATKALEEAYGFGKINLVEIAVDHGAKVNDILEGVVQSGDMKLAELLLENGGDANKTLQIAVENQNVSMAEMALRNGANANKGRYIQLAVDEENILLTKLLLENGADARTSGVVASSVKNKNMELTRLLLESGGDPDEGIEFAVDKNESKMAILLLEKGADGSKKSLIETAAKREDTHLVEMLLKRGASPSHGLPFTIENNDLTTTRTLIEAGAVIHDPEYLKNTIEKNKDAMTMLLLEKDAPTGYTSKRGETLLHLACENEKIDIVRTLINKNLDVSAKDRNGETPLFAAVRSGKDNLEIVKLLLDNGANLNAKNNKGQSVLSRAKGKKVKKYLEENGAIE